MTQAMLPPIAVSVSVPWNQQEAYRRFVKDFATWWPRATHSIGGPRVKHIVFEEKVGGCIYEEHVDGRRFQWGQVLALDPPRSVTFSFHPSKDPATAQDVELQFAPEGSGTRLTLTASKWENWGRGAERARRGYKLGWGYILKLWAGERTLGMRALSGIGLAATWLQLLIHGGRQGLIGKARGEITRLRAATP